MFSFYWPIALIVLSNIVYHICSKSVPAAVNPFASLTVTYLIGAAASAAAFALLGPGGGLLAQYRSLNWSSFALGIAIVGLEAGSIYMYKAGWDVSAGQLVYSAILSVCLIFVGYLLYHEAITATKLAGVALCLCGLYLISK